MNNDALIEQIAESGLGDLEIPAADTESLGANPEIVEEACGILSEQAKGIGDLETRLTDIKEALLANWEGNTAEEFETEFTDMINAFNEVPENVISIAKFAQEACDGYLALDKQI